MSMLFNFGKKSGSGSGGGKGKAIEITVNGKTLSADPGQKAVNLRKELTKNKIDVYSLRGKFDNCGGSGICGRCAVEVVDGKYSSITFIDICTYKICTLCFHSVLLLQPLIITFNPFDRSKELQPSLQE